MRQLESEQQHFINNLIKKTQNIKHKTYLCIPI